MKKLFYLIFFSCTLFPMQPGYEENYAGDSHESEEDELDELADGLVNQLEESARREINELIERSMWQQQYKKLTSGQRERLILKVQCQLAGVLALAGEQPIMPAPINMSTSSDVARPDS